MTQLDDKNPRRYRSALEILQLAKQDVQNLCDEVRQLISDTEGKISQLKQEALKKRKQTGVNVKPSTEDGEEDLNDEVFKNLALETQTRNLGSLKNRFRDYRMLEHQIVFTFGDLYHCLGQSYASSEDEAYEAADKIRKELLKGKPGHLYMYQCNAYI